MPLIQSGCNQRRIGVNLSRIIGLQDAAERMTAANGARLNGGLGVVYFNGGTAATDATGTSPTCTQCGGGGDDDNPTTGGGGGSGGGSGGGGDGGGTTTGGGGGVVTPCGECVSPAEAVALLADGITPCCIDAQDCETGDEVNVHISSANTNSYGEGCVPLDFSTDCPTPLVVVLWSSNGSICQEFWVGKVISAATTVSGAIQLGQSAALSQAFCAGNKQLESLRSSYPTQTWTMEVSLTETETIRICGSPATFERAAGYTIYKDGVRYSGKSWQFGVGVVTAADYAEYVENFKKNQGYTLQNGKFYQNCGITPLDCVDVCGDDGKIYKICYENNKLKVSEVE